MKKSELRSLIKEVVTELLNKQWDADGLEVVVDGKTYYANANFDWGTEALDLDPGTGKEQVGKVPQSVFELEAFDENSQPVIDKRLLERIKEEVLSSFYSSEKRVRDPKWV